MLTRLRMWVIPRLLSCAWSAAAWTEPRKMPGRTSDIGFTSPGEKKEGTSKGWLFREPDICNFFLPGYGTMLFFAALASGCCLPEDLRVSLGTCFQRLPSGLGWHVAGLNARVRGLIPLARLQLLQVQSSSKAREAPTV